MEKEWHRDRIEELKNASSNHKWHLSLALTALIGLLSIIYLVWYSQPEWYVKITLLIIAIYIIKSTGKSIKSNISHAKRIHKQITHNYNVLLNRKK